MSFCSFAEGAGMYDVTPIENMFLLEYLPMTPEQFLRVYLYARMACLHPELCSSMDEMAKSLHMDAEEIYDAMTYWERQGLAMRMSDNPPTFAILPMHNSASNNPLEKEMTENLQFQRELQSIFGQTLLHREHYFLADEWKSWGLGSDAILCLVKTFVDNHLEKRKTMPDPYRLFRKKLNPIVQDFVSRGITTTEAIERELRFQGLTKETAKNIITRFGMRRSPSEDELAMVERWLKEWNLAPEFILEKCAETTKAYSPSFKYLESILESSVNGDDSALRESLKIVLDELGTRYGYGKKIPDNILESYKQLLAMGFESETIRLAAVQCSRKNKHRFEDLTWMLDEWGKKDLFCYDKAAAYLQQIDATKEKIAQLKEICGLPRSVSISDINFYEKWREQSSIELIAYAAECARGMYMPMRYIDKLLTEWEKNGVKTPEDARAQHEAHRAAQPAASAAAVNPALNYEQHDKTETNYNSLFIDLDSYGKGGDEA